MELGDGVRAIYQNLTVAQEPIRHRYQQPGIYQVTVKAENAAGHDTATVYIQVSGECPPGVLGEELLLEGSCQNPQLIQEPADSSLCSRVLLQGSPSSRQRFLSCSTATGSPPGGGSCGREEPGGEPEC